MCCVVLRQLLFLVVILTVKGTSLPKIVDVKYIPCVSCKLPQPRSIVLAQEVQITEDTAPYMTTLYRCDAGSGCCTTRGSICKVAKWEILNASIYVLETKTRKHVKRYFEIANHTECSCQNSSDTPK